MKQRPDPDQLLKRVQAEESTSASGQLKLFFGAVAGVGKTYAMLEAARQRKKEGWDLVVGVIETHGRVETEALLEGLEVLPRKEMDHKGVRLREFDIDATLSRRPTLVLVDELAHTNAPGSRHIKRWQDVEELLDAGIHVYTTLNVQHWESLNDVVAQITGVVVRETVPDSFLQRTHELELVDLAPEDLLKRLKEGKVYRGDQADLAADHFFKPGNLIALRELALRHAAERVDAQMQAYKERNAVAGLWPVGEHLLVGVSPSPMSARLLRATHRMTTRLRGRWTAAHVETPAFSRLSTEDRNRVINNLRLAEKLGAQTVTLTGTNVTEELFAYARKHNITKMVLGKPAQPRWKEWVFGSVVNEAAHHCGDIDLYIISGFGSDLSARRTATDPAQTTRRAFRSRAGIFLLAIGAWALSYQIERVHPLWLYWLVVVAAVIIGALIRRLQWQARQMRNREERTRTLYILSRELSETPHPSQLIETASHRLKEFYRQPVLLLTPQVGGSLSAAAGEDVAGFGWDSHEQTVARWVYEHAQMAGCGTDTLAGSKGLYLPLKGIRKIVGVLGIRPTDPASLQAPEQLRLLETFASEIGGALESTRLTEAAGRAEMQLELLALASTSAKPARSLADALDSARIVFLSPGQSRDQILKRLIDTLQLANPAQAFDAIEERERITPTVLESGVVVPHARLASVQEVKAVLGISAKDPVPIWVLFLGPAEDPKAHLAFLAQVANFFQSANRIAELTLMRSPEAILEYIRRNG